MTNTTIKIHNTATGEVIEREKNGDELEQMALDKAADVVQAKAEAVEATAKSAAFAKLEKLGLTVADLEALGL